MGRRIKRTTTSAPMPTADVERDEHASHEHLASDTNDSTPLDRALRNAELIDAMVPRMRGPSATTLRAWRAGVGSGRSDAIVKLAFVLGLSESATRVIVKATIEQARARRARETSS